MSTEVDDFLHQYQTRPRQTGKRIMMEKMRQDLLAQGKRVCVCSIHGSSIQYIHKRSGFLVINSVPRKRGA